MKPFLDQIFGLQGGSNVWQMAMRAAVIYLMSVLLIRAGSDKRLMGKHAPFDMILAIIFGSVMSRAVNGSAPFFQTIGVGAVFVLLHWIFSVWAFRSRAMRALLQGRPLVLVRDGEIQRKNLDKALITDEELKEALRIHGKLFDPRAAKLAQQECNGEISVIPAE
jgi:uncharacterized membrane protein YcaP (DUF421 family)